MPLSPRRVALGAAAAVASLARAQLLQDAWPNVAFAPESAATRSLAPAVNITDDASVPPWSSLRFTGLLTWPTNATLNFTLLTDGGVRLWVDDHLTVDDGGNHTPGAPRLSGPFLPIPVVAGVPQPLRLEYSHWGAAPATLQLLWSDAGSPMPSLVPPSALSPVVSDAQLARQAVRDRLEAPPVPWQTYANPSMGGQVHMPSGVTVDVTLGDAGTGATLGPWWVFRQFNPAAVRMGLHSADGSAYTEASIASWKWRDCNVSVQTTVVAPAGGPPGAPPTQLQLLATPMGAGCDGLLLVVSARMATERAGNCTAAPAAPGDAGAPGAGFTCEAPGFPPIAVVPLGGPSPVPFPPANLTPSFALPLTPAGGPVGYVAAPTDGGAAPVPPPVATVQGDLAAARAALHAAAVAAFGPDDAEVYEAMHSVMAWNTIFTPIDGVITPVGRTWDFGSGYSLFCWDNLFLGLMASTLDGMGANSTAGGAASRLRDIGYSNLIQTVLGRTLAGFVPNWASGRRVSFDRSEPQIGAQVLLRVVTATGDAWLVDLLLDALLGWAEWVWAARRGQGVWGAASPDGFAPLVVLGTDRTNPPGDGSAGTFQGARYESGLDNSPMYDSPPVGFNHSVGRMELYDVGMTGLLLGELRALVALAELGGRPEVVPTLTARADAVAAALNAHLVDPQSGLYTNALYNGSFVRRIAPTSLFPLLGGAASAAQAAAAAQFAASPLGFCMNTSATPHADAVQLMSWVNHGYSRRPGKGDSAACGTDACHADAAHAWYDWVRLEAAVLAPDAPPPPGPALHPLNRFYSAAHADTAVTTNATGPDDTYAFVQREGWCFGSPADADAATGAAAGAAPPTTPLTLHLLVNATAKVYDYATCGSDACRAQCAADGYAPLGTLCTAWDAASPATAPCVVGGASIARADPAFADQAYWRGQMWGPHVALLYWALDAYAPAVPPAAAARTQLAAQARSALLRSWRAFGFVSEHYNGVLGMYDWDYNLDPAYHWGALLGHVALEEARQQRRAAAAGRADSSYPAGAGVTRPPRQG